LYWLTLWIEFETLNKIADKKIRLFDMNANMAAGVFKGQYTTHSKSSKIYRL